VTLKVGTVGISESLQHFVNDGLMSLFFVVALESKESWSSGTCATCVSPPSRLPPLAAAWSSRPRSTWHSTSPVKVLTDGAFPWPPTSPSPLVYSLSWDDGCR
jgi:hypothetical protein